VHDEIANLRAASYADLIDLIEGRVSEGHTLEYKGREALLEEFDIERGGNLISQKQSRDEIRRELSIDVSSFANADGGTIIYGAIENKKEHAATGFRGYDLNRPSKETLEQWIQGNIRPQIPGLRIHPVVIPGTAPVQVVYVVTIPKGTTCHQAGDQRYYRRDNFNRRVLYDDEIRDIQNRVSGPVLSIAFEPPPLHGFLDDSMKLKWDSSDEWSEPVVLHVIAHNDGATALYSSHRLYVQRPFPGPVDQQFSVFKPDPYVDAPPREDDRRGVERGAEPASGAV
jgi:Putative DNA-binding domain